MKFEYILKGDLSIDSYCDNEQLAITRSPENKEVVICRSLNNGEVSILANQEGWLYLAKLCIEMSFLSKIDPGIHLHRNQELEVDGESPDLVGLYNISAELEQSILSKRNA